MNENAYWYVVGGLTGVVLIVASGVLPWAITGGVVSSGATFAVSRQWKGALAAGIAVAVIISLFGVMAMLSPGWYRDVL